MAPKTTVVNIHRKQPYTVNITRGPYNNPYKWGNPYELASRKPKDVVACLLSFARYMKTAGPLEDVHQLRGQSLGCFCAPARCHGDILARLADSDTPEDELDIIIAELESELATFTQGELF